MFFWMWYTVKFLKNLYYELVMGKIIIMTSPIPIDNGNRVLENLEYDYHLKDCTGLSPIKITGKTDLIQEAA